MCFTQYQLVIAATACGCVLLLAKQKSMCQVCVRFENTELKEMLNDMMNVGNSVCVRLHCRATNRHVLHVLLC